MDGTIMSTTTNRRYALISPCRDEADYLRITIETVAAQSVPPTKWVIVDDGSTDETPAILAEASEKYPFIQVVRREDRGERKVGPGVIDAFYDGLSRIDMDEFDYICKFDCDLEMPPRYFERIMEKFESDERLGTISGKLYLRYGDDLVHEYCGDENSVGPAKFYRVECFKQIGGFVREVSWDGIDGHMCRMNRWIAASVDEPDLRIIHLRRMGSSQKSFWTGRLRWGRGKYFMGSAWYYVLAVSIFRAFERPFFISGYGILWGYIKAMFSSVPRFDDREFRRHLRRFELKSLLHGKRRAVQMYNEQIHASSQQSKAVESTRIGSTAGALNISDARTAQRQRIIAISSGGGHWIELLRLQPAFEGHDITYVTVDRAYQSDVQGHAFHTVLDVTRWNKLRWIISALQIVWILLRHRPHIVLSTGALPGYMAIRLGKMLLGARTVWIDSIANVDELSMSGQKIGRHADMWLTQWAHLAKPGGPQFRGAVL